MAHITELLAKMSPQMVEFLWGDQNITNVRNLDRGYYAFDVHIMSHGRHIRAATKVEFVIKQGGDIICNVISSESY